MKKNKSTSQWIEKHRSDHYFQKAKEMGYRSRSSIKLIQIDDKYKLLKPGKRILELGSYPGGWSQVINERVFSKNTKWDSRWAVHSCGPSISASPIHYCFCGRELAPTC